MTINDKLQSIFRDYAERMRNVATKHGLGKWLDNILQANCNNECSATEEEVEMMARLVDDDRLTRLEIPPLLEKSYRMAFEDEDFENIKKLRHVGIYSKVNALLYAFKLKKDKENGNQRQSTLLV